MKLFLKSRSGITRMRKVLRHPSDALLVTGVLAVYKTGYENVRAEEFATFEN
jgi:sulfur transfer protein SufE